MRPPPNGGGRARPPSPEGFASERRFNEAAPKRGRKGGGSGSGSHGDKSFNEAAPKRGRKGHPCNLPESLVFWTRLHAGRFRASLYGVHVLPPNFQTLFMPNSASEFSTLHARPGFHCARPCVQSNLYLTTPGNSTIATSNRRTLRRWCSLSSEAQPTVQAESRPGIRVAEQNPPRPSQSSEKDISRPLRVSCAAAAG